MFNFITLHEYFTDKEILVNYSYILWISESNNDSSIIHFSKRQKPLRVKEHYGKIRMMIIAFKQNGLGDLRTLNTDNKNDK